MRTAFRKLALAAMTCSAASIAAQVNPTNQINWPLATGVGAPTVTCQPAYTGPGTAGYGAPYTDVMNGAYYVCGKQGGISKWLPSSMGGPFLPIPGGQLSGPVTGTTAAFLSTDGEQNEAQYPGIDLCVRTTNAIAGGSKVKVPEIGVCGGGIQIGGMAAPWGTPTRIEFTKSGIIYLRAPFLMTNDADQMIGMGPPANDDAPGTTLSWVKGNYKITLTSISGGFGIYTWSLVYGLAPAPGDLIFVRGTTNGSGTMNVTNVPITSVTGTSTAGTFSVSLSGSASPASECSGSPQVCATATNSGTYTGEGLVVGNGQMCAATPGSCSPVNGHNPQGTWIQGMRLNGNPAMQGSVVHFVSAFSPVVQSVNVTCGGALNNIGITFEDSLAGTMGWVQLLNYTSNGCDVDMVSKADANVSTGSNLYQTENSQPRTMGIYVKSGHNNVFINRNIAPTGLYHAQTTAITRTNGIVHVATALRSPEIFADSSIVPHYFSHTGPANLTIPINTISTVVQAARAATNSFTITSISAPDVNGLQTLTGTITGCTSDTHPLDQSMYTVAGSVTGNNGFYIAKHCTATTLTILNSNGLSDTTSLAMTASSLAGVVGVQLTYPLDAFAATKSNMSGLTGYVQNQDDSSPNGPVMVDTASQKNTVFSYTSAGLPESFGVAGAKMAIAPWKITAVAADHTWVEFAQSSPDETATGITTDTWSGTVTIGVLVDNSARAILMGMLLESGVAFPPDGTMSIGLFLTALANGAECVGGGTIGNDIQVLNLTNTHDTQNSCSTAAWSDNTPRFSKLRLGDFGRSSISQYESGSTNYMLLQATSDSTSATLSAFQVKTQDKVTQLEAGTQGVHIPGTLFFGPASAVGVNQRSRIFSTPNTLIILGAGDFDQLIQFQSTFGIGMASIGPSHTRIKTDIVDTGTISTTGLIPTPIVTPTAPSCSAVTSAFGGMTAGTYYVKLEGYDTSTPVTHGIGGAEGSATITSQNALSCTLPVVTNATVCRLYIGPSSGGENTYYSVDYLSVPVPCAGGTFLVTQNVGPNSGSPDSFNTSGLAQGGVCQIPPGGVIAFNQTAVNSGGVTAVFGSGGTGMTPGTYALSFSGGGGSGAAGTITVTSSTAFNTPVITASGSGFTSAPAVTAATGGTPPTLTSTLAASTVFGSFNLPPLGATALVKVYIRSKGGSSNLAMVGPTTSFNGVAVNNFNSTANASKDWILTWDIQGQGSVSAQNHYPANGLSGAGLTQSLEQSTTVDWSTSRALQVSYIPGQLLDTEKGSMMLQICASP